jgi:enediyne biosynthesis protein E4
VQSSYWAASAILLLFVALTLACPGRTYSQILFEDLHEQAGLTSPNRCEGNRPFLPRLMVAGLAVFDFDNDGLEDILLLDQTAPSAFLSENVMPEQPRAGLGRLYRNCGPGKFQDVTNQAGLNHDLFALGTVTGDIDNDGDQDLFISSYGPLLCFMNQGDGTFVLHDFFDGKENLSAEKLTPFGAGLALLDIDNDGMLDLFEGRYVDFSIAQFESQSGRSFPYPPGPKDFPPSTDRLFRNVGTGQFDDVTQRAGLDKLPGPTMGVIAGDWDGDGDADLFLCSDAAPNQLLVNNGHGEFSDQAVQAGLAFDLSGNVNGSMGVDAGDFDNDGLLDLLITNYTGQVPVLYRNLGGGSFEDVSRKTQIGRTVLPHTNWGVSWIDVDLDGDLDAFMANGHFLKNIKQIDDRTDFRVANTLMENIGNMRFRDISKSAGPGLLVQQSSRGTGWADFDLDGDLDGVVLNEGATPTLLVNSSVERGSWLSLKLVGRRSNRDAVQAQVTIRFGDQTRIAVVHAGRGYQSHYGLQLHFGLGAISSIDSIVVRWPSGNTEQFKCDKLNQRLVLVEDSKP